MSPFSFSRVIFPGLPFAPSHQGGASTRRLFQVTKLILRHVPNPHTNQVLYEAEVFFKDSKGRRKLDLLIKYASNEKVGVCTGSSNNSASSSPYKGNNNGGTTSSPSVEHGWILDGTNDEMRRELKAYGTIIGDMWRYLREDKGVAEPERFLCLPQRYKQKLWVDFPLLTHIAQV